MTQSRKFRGYVSQRLVAEWFSNHGWPFAESAGAGRPGVDVTGMPGVAVEVKARRNFNMVGFLRQATTERRKGLPVVVIRPDGFGPARISEWGALMTLADFTELLRLAGYGSPATEVDNITTSGAE